MISISERVNQGHFNTHIAKAAASENLLEELITSHLSEGSLVLVKNKNRAIDPLPIGNGTRIKINANIGTSTACADLETELKKLDIAVQAGADAIMDLSTGGPIKEIRERIVAKSPVAVGTVPIYQAVADNEILGNMPHQMKVSDFFRVVEMHCREGVDFLTLHCGINKRTAEALMKSNRLTGVVSRGGALTLEWMSKNGKENPYYENFNELLAILREYEVTISLGDGLRPGSIHDATDNPQLEELATLGDLVLRCREVGVQAMVEGPGHIPLHEIEKNIKLQKKLCHNAPFYVLGPLVTDVSPGYDHIAGAIGGAIAGMAGADFLCYLTPAEHLRLPSIEDVKEGVIASRIAAHAVDVARGSPGAVDADNKISHAKANLNWHEFMKYCIDPDKAKKYRESLPALESELCSMCGKFCAMKRNLDLSKADSTQ